MIWLPTGNHQTRYILDYQIARRKIVKAFPEIENLISNVEEMYKEYVNEFEEDEQENNLEINKGYFSPF